MSALNPTPMNELVDAQGRPYFLWDVDVTLERFRALLRDPDPDTRAYVIGKLMRQAKPDDVFTFVTESEIRASWDRLERYLGHQRAFWRWLLDCWREQDVERGPLWLRQMRQRTRKTVARRTAGARHLFRRASSSSAR